MTAQQHPPCCCKRRKGGKPHSLTCQAEAAIRSLRLAGTWLAPLETRLLAITHFAVGDPWNMRNKLRPGGRYRYWLGRLRRLRPPIDPDWFVGTGDCGLAVDLDEAGLVQLANPPARSARSGPAPVPPPRVYVATCTQCGRPLAGRNEPGQPCWPCRADAAIATASGTVAWLEPLRVYLRAEARKKDRRRGGSLKGAYARILHLAAQEPRPVDHAWFYNKIGREPDGCRAVALRADLMHVGILPPIADERGLPHAMRLVEVVISERAAALNPADLKTLRRYFQWGVFHRVRRQRRTAYTAALYYNAAKARAVLLCDFCAWIHTQGKCLTTIGPGDWNTWRQRVYGKPAELVGVLLRWLHQRKEVSFYPTPERTPSPLERQDAAKRRDEHRALLTDETIPLRMRVAALFVRLGLKHVEVAAIPRSDIVLGKRVALLRGENALPLRTDFGELVRHLVTDGDPTGAKYADDASSAWLFPGRRRGHHISAMTLWRQMKVRGFGNRQARNSFLAETAQSFVRINALAHVFPRNENFAATWRDIANSSHIDYVRYRYHLENGELDQTVDGKTQTRCEGEHP